jgi:hypothetical protein
LLALDVEQARAYSALVDHLMTSHVRNEDLSQRSVESFLQDAIFAALDLPSRSRKKFETRLTAALQVLLNRLKAPSHRFECWVPIDGVTIDTRSAQFAGIRFVTFGKSQLRQIASRASAAARRQAAWKFITAKLQEHIRLKPCAVVEIDAKDSEAAQALAVRRSRQILDILNVFVDLVPYNDGWFYLPGETTRTKQIVPTQRQDGTLTANATTPPPRADVSWKSLWSVKRLVSPLRTLSNLATKKAYGAQLLFSGAQWVGRATVDRRREQSFLLYGIALETMVLPTTEGQSVAQKLRLRVAHVLGRTVDARKQIAKEVSRLYGIRSKVVHSGSYEVNDIDLARLRFIVKGVLFALLRNRKLHSMSREQIAEWFDRKLLR